MMSGGEGLVAGGGASRGDEEICVRRERRAEEDVRSERPNVVLIE